jgi:hypothetical protein
MMALTEAEIRDVLEKFSEYVRSRHNTGSWWNDSYAFRTMEKVIKPSLAKLAAPPVQTGDDGALL